jgi:hypothetical protein
LPNRGRGNFPELLETPSGKGGEEDAFWFLQYPLSSSYRTSREAVVVEKRVGIRMLKRISVILVLALLVVSLAASTALAEEPPAGRGIGNR